ncbi:MAG: hypothetical protein K6F44_04970 [Lachnospiraceae bacterium]|nr:hypothetical protein [Lachnospiraceae bacterium]
MNVWITERGLFSNDRHDYPISHSTPVNKIEAPERVSDNYSIVREIEQSYVAENTPAYNVSISGMGRAALQSMVELSKNFDAYYDQLATDYLDERTAEPEDTEEVRGDRVTDETVDEGNVGVANDVVNGLDTGNIYGPDGQESITEVANDLDTRIQEDIYEPAEDTSVQTIYDNVVSDIGNEQLFEETEGTLEAQLVEEPGNIDVLNEIEPENALSEPVELADVSEVEPGTDRLVEPTIEEQENQEQVREALKPDNNPIIRQAVAAYNYQMSFAVNLAMTQ